MADGADGADIIVVGAGAAGLAAAIFARRANPQRSVVLLDSARRPGAKILVSGGVALQRHQRHRHRTRFLGRTLHRSSAACCERSALDDAVRFFQRARRRACTRKPAANSFQTRTARATCSMRCCANCAHAARRSTPVAASSTSSETARRRFASLTDARRSDGVGRRPGHGRAVAAENRQRRRRLRDRPAARSHDRADDSGAGPAGAEPTPNRFIASVSGVAHDVELAIWIDGAHRGTRLPARCCGRISASADRSQ